MLIKLSDIKIIFISLTMVMLSSIYSHHSQQVDEINRSYNTIVDSTYLVSTEIGTGTGVAISSNQILTAYHVVGTQKEITFFNFSGTLFFGVVSKIDPDKDLALVTVVTDKGLPSYLPISNIDLFSSLSYRDELLVSGYPLGDNLAITKGYYQSSSVDYYTHRASASIMMGNSGGPVVYYNPEKMRYEVVGIAVAVPVSGPILFENMTLFVPNDILNKFIQTDSGEIKDAK